MQASASSISSRSGDAAAGSDAPHEDGTFVLPGRVLKTILAVRPTLNDPKIRWILPVSKEYCLRAAQRSVWQLWRDTIGVEALDGGITANELLNQIARVGWQAYQQGGGPYSSGQEAPPAAGAAGLTSEQMQGEMVQPAHPAAAHVPVPLNAAATPAPPTSSATNASEVVTSQAAALSDSSTSPAAPASSARPAKRAGAAGARKRPRDKAPVDTQQLQQQAPKKPAKKPRQKAAAAAPTHKRKKSDGPPRTSVAALKSSAVQPAAAASAPISSCKPAAHPSISHLPAIPSLGSPLPPLTVYRDSPYQYIVDPFAFPSTAAAPAGYALPHDGTPLLPYPGSYHDLALMHMHGYGHMYGTPEGVPSPPMDGDTFQACAPAHGYRVVMMAPPPPPHVHMHATSAGQGSHQVPFPPVPGLRAASAQPQSSFEYALQPWPACMPAGLQSGSAPTPSQISMQHGVFHSVAPGPEPMRSAALSSAAARSSVESLLSFASGVRGAGGVAPSRRPPAAENRHDPQPPSPDQEHVADQQRAAAAAAEVGAGGLPPGSVHVRRSATLWSARTHPAAQPLYDEARGSDAVSEDRAQRTRTY